MGPLDDLVFLGKLVRLENEDYLVKMENPVTKGYKDRQDFQVRLVLLVTKVFL